MVVMIQKVCALRHIEYDLPDMKQKTVLKLAIHHP